jgi:ABC-type phosphonate transport system ATPase subunit
VSEWQPIETAPKDGTRLLVACVGECGTRWMYVAWNKKRHWRLMETKTGSFMEVHDTPTHWMPLPDPPKP